MRTYLIHLAKSFVMLFMLSGFLGATELRSILFLDSAGVPLPNVVIEVEAVPLDEPLPNPSDYVMEQINFQFSPVVLTIPRHAAVRFPNRDESRHHVYSFSEAKIFELDLFAGNQAPPVTFDNTGIVAVGCNIHDKMNAHIYITEAPIVVKSNEYGLATVPRFEASDNQEIQVWHPYLMKPLTFSLTELDIDKNNHATLSLPIVLPELTETNTSSDLRDRLKSYNSNGN